MQKVSKTEWYLFHNNMVCLVKALEGKYTVVDLRNEACVSGSAQLFDSFFIKARNVRYVHIPKETPAIELMENQLDHMSTPLPRQKTRTYKEKRSRQYHEEIVRELQANQ